VFGAFCATEKKVAHSKKVTQIHTQTVREMADFFKNFMDRYHHAKEEKHLFVMLNARGVPRDNGPLAVMLREHE